MKKRKINMRSQSPGATGMDFVHSSSALKRIAYRLLPVADYIKLLLSRSMVAIHGSYFTTNVGDRAIGVVLNRHFDLEHLPTIKTKLERLCRDCSLYFIPFVGEDLEFLRDQLSDVPMTCLRLRGPVATYKALLEMDRVIATRYHSAIFSLLAGKPVMILAYSEKVVSLALDLELKYVDLGDPREQSFEFNEQVDGELIQRKIREAEQQIDRIVSHLV